MKPVRLSRPYCTSYDSVLGLREALRDKAAHRERVLQAQLLALSVILIAVAVVSAVTGWGF